MHRSSFPTIFQKFIIINIQSDSCKHSPPPLPSPSKKNVARGSWATSLTWEQLQSIYTFAQSYYNTCTIMIHVTLIKRKKTLSLFWELKVLNLWKLLHPIARMLCAKFGWNWPRHYGEKRWKCEKFTDRQTDGLHTTDNRRSEKLSWAFSSNELKLKKKMISLFTKEKLCIMYLPLLFLYTVWKFFDDFFSLNLIKSFTRG